MGEVIRFVPKSERERDRLIREARAIYDSVFPPADLAAPRLVQGYQAQRACADTNADGRDWRALARFDLSGTYHREKYSADVAVNASERTSPKSVVAPCDY
jgi:hypothetical protein